MFWLINLFFNNQLFFSPSIKNAQQLYASLKELFLKQQTMSITLIFIILLFPVLVLKTLNNYMRAVHKSRLNAALIIQIFTHITHHMQQFILNNLLKYKGYCSLKWARRLLTRITYIDNWAEKQVKVLCFLFIFLFNLTIKVIISNNW